MFIYKAGVIGAGTMGSGIAQVISFSGLPVVLKDIDKGAVDRGIEAIRKIYSSRVNKGKMTSDEMEQKMALITGTTTYDAFQDVDIVIEAVSESVEIKKMVLKELDKVCQSSAIFASNTSAISISELASSTKRPDKVIGMHFFNPAHIMKLVEIIPGLQTGEETITDVISFAESLRKITVKVNECAGFLVNRLLMPYLNEAFFCLQEGNDPKEIDKKMVEFGMPMGPFALVDMLGLDICADVADILFHSYGERMRPAVIIKRLTKLDRLGIKSGMGVYGYGSDTGEAQLKGLIDDIKRETGIPETKFSIGRLMMTMINEAATAYQENVSSVNAIDIAMMAGTGFPQDKGGPLHYADALGLDYVLQQLNSLYNSFGLRFWPAPIIKRYLAAGYIGIKAKKGFFEYL